jgi:hypothetical protein
VSMKSMTRALLTSLSVLVSGCGVASQGQSSSLVEIISLAGGSVTESGKAPTFSQFLLSDVRTKGSVFDDLGQVTMIMHLKDPGTPVNANAPSALNDVTFTHYHVVYRRTDGRNTPGVDVPYAFDSAATFTVSSTNTTAAFELVRHVAKEEAPLASLVVNNAVLITTIADVTFYGKDQGGKNVSVTGSIQVTFGDFADPS